MTGDGHLGELVVRPALMEMEWLGAIDTDIATKSELNFSKRKTKLGIGFSLQNSSI